MDAVTEYLTELVACDCSRVTIRSYAYDLAVWLSFLAARQTSWSNATQIDVRDHVLWMKDTPPRSPRMSVAASDVDSSAGGHAASTINHRLTVISGFYAFHERNESGPAVNPVPQRGRRRSHISPMEPWVYGTRAAYRQRVPRPLPRAVEDALFAETFATLDNDRDRALVTMLVSTGARASELLGIRGADLDWGGQRVALIGKGDRIREWVAASPEAFVWLAKYLTQRCPLESTGEVWLTLRRPFRPLKYPALRAVLRRVNIKTGARVALHDLRHTCALRLASDPQVSLVDVQSHLRHRHLSSTQVYLVAPPEQVIASVRAHHQRNEAPEPARSPVPGGWTYDGADMAELFGPQS
jgi:site-specific recombinase XerD